MPQRAVFLDRDGVINFNHGYVHKIENFDFIDGVFDVARQAYGLGYKIVVITNQAGIGRGYYSEEDFHRLSDWMCGVFAEAGAPIDRVYFSPFHPTAGIGRYKKEDFSRKPQPGMIVQAAQELDLDLPNSILIGDKASDIQAGVAADVGVNILFAQERPPELDGVAYHSITALREALPFLGGGQPLLRA
ncbi:MAG: D-glycero-beta-D-manno-heptose 1,7-bisphosphate 7-phosphatase [Betaproteobacteria bacterium]|nr:D-glycero-beta-D-manno-heptose 1,7-bisphosphate 7-phosphatase [Betaproteobacteria bacterium]